MSTSNYSKATSSSNSRSPTRNKNSAPRPTWSQNAVRQLKLIIPGGLVTWYLGTVDKFLVVLKADEGSLRSKTALLALGNGITMVALFLYVLIRIYTKGQHPDWRTWRQTGSLSTVIPILTVTIILGWILHVVVLGQWSGMGYFKGFISATALYALTFGLLALIPSPTKKRRN